MDAEQSYIVIKQQDHMFKCDTVVPTYFADLFGLRQSIESRWNVQMTHRLAQLIAILLSFQVNIPGIF